MVPGCAYATLSSSSAWIRARSSSVCAKVGCIATSATSASAGSSKGSATVIEMLDWFQPAPLSSDPPSASAAVASAVALCLRVPLVSKVAVSVARPESFSGSASLPESTSRFAVTRRTPRALGQHDAQPVRQLLLDRRRDRERPGGRGSRRGRIRLGLREVRCEQRGQQHAGTRHHGRAHFALPSCVYSTVTWCAAATYFFITRLTSATVTRCRSASP